VHSANLFWKVGFLRDAITNDKDEFFLPQKANGSKDENGTIFFMADKSCQLRRLSNNKKDSANR
jgi:hypothetical protein